MGVQVMRSKTTLAGKRGSIMKSEKAQYTRNGGRVAVRIDKTKEIHLLEISDIAPTTTEEMRVKLTGDGSSKGFASNWIPAVQKWEVRWKNTDLGGKEIISKPIKLKTNGSRSPSPHQKSHPQKRKGQTKQKARCPSKQGKKTQPSKSSLPEGWQEMKDRASGQIYYMNWTYRFTQRDRPSYNWKLPDLPSGWYQEKDTSGQIYYSNPSQNKSQWNRPMPVKSVDRRRLAGHPVFRRLL